MKTQQNFNSLEAIYCAGEGHQITLQEIIDGRSFIGGKWQDIEISPETKEAAFVACIEIIGGRKETKKAMLSRLKWGGKLQHWGLRRFFLVKYGQNKAAQFTYCCGQDWPTEMRQIRAFIKGK